MFTYEEGYKIRQDLKKIYDVVSVDFDYWTSLCFTAKTKEEADAAEMNSNKAFRILSAYNELSEAILDATKSVEK